MGRAVASGCAVFAYERQSRIGVVHGLRAATPHTNESSNEYCENERCKDGVLDQHTDWSTIAESGSIGALRARRDARYLVSGQPSAVCSMKERLSTRRSKASPWSLWKLKMMS